MNYKYDFLIKLLEEYLTAEPDGECMVKVIKSTNRGAQTKMMLNDLIAERDGTPKYYLCTKNVVEQFPPISKSEFFKSGFDREVGPDLYCIALYDDKQFAGICNYKIAVVVPYNANTKGEKIEFKLSSCSTYGYMDNTNITTLDMAKNGVFPAIVKDHNFANFPAKAILIAKMAQEYERSPIELIDDVIKFSADFQK